jgi:hypothetical protein
MGDQRKRKQENSGERISRRNPLKLAETAAIGAGVLPKLVWLDDAVATQSVTEEIAE